MRLYHFRLHMRSSGYEAAILADNQEEAIGKLNDVLARIETPPHLYNSLKK